MTVNLTTNLNFKKKTGDNLSYVDLLEKITIYPPLKNIFNLHQPFLQIVNNRR